MNLYDFDHSPIEQLTVDSIDVLKHVLNAPDTPAILSFQFDAFSFLRACSLEFLKELPDPVPIQKPEPDGVNRFIHFQNMTMKDFFSRIEQGDELYIGAKQFFGLGGEPSEKDGLGKLAEVIELPCWIDRKRIESGNLWVGPGDNHTLLHYDPWDSILIVLKGEKEIVLYPPEESENMYQYSAWNFKALVEGRVLHSKIFPRKVQKKYHKKISRAKGYRGILKEGEMLIIPSGYWHYVESRGMNIAINFFMHSVNVEKFNFEPLKTYRIKDNITLQPVRKYWKLKSKIFSTIKKYLKILKV